MAGDEIKSLGQYRTGQVANAGIYVVIFAFNQITHFIDKLDELTGQNQG